MKTALLAGSTGLIGKQLLQLLLKDPYYEKVKAITRKPLDIQHPKLENVILDFDTLTEHYSSVVWAPPFASRKQKKPFEE